MVDTWAMAVSDKPDTLHALARGNDERIYHKFFANGGWGPGGIMGDWECIGGLPGGKEFQGLPLAVSDKPDTLHIFGHGADDKAYHKFFAGGGWAPGGISGDWECIGGVSQHPWLTAISDKPDTLHVFMVVNGAAYHKCFANGVWAPGGIGGDWECLGGPAENIGFSDLTAVSDKPNTLHIFGLGLNNNLVLHKFGVQGLAGGLNWTGNSQVHGASSKTAPALTVFNNKLWVAFVSNDANNKVLVCSSADGQTWTGNSQVHGESSRTAPSPRTLTTGRASS